MPMPSQALGGRRPCDLSSAGRWSRRARDTCSWRIDPALGNIIGQCKGLCYAAVCGDEAPFLIRSWKHTGSAVSLHVAVENTWAIKNHRRHRVSTKLLPNATNRCCTRMSTNRKKHPQLSTCEKQIILLYKLSSRG